MILLVGFGGGRFSGLNEYFSQIHAQCISDVQHGFQRRDAMAFLHVANRLLRQPGTLRHHILGKAALFARRFQQLDYALTLGVAVFG
jgi:hypothetical protein